MTTTATDPYTTAHDMLTTAGLPGHTADRLLDDVPADGLTALADYTIRHPDAATLIANMRVDQVGFLLDLDQLPATALLFRNTLQAVTR